MVDALSLLEASQAVHSPLRQWFLMSRGGVSRLCQFRHSPAWPVFGAVVLGVNARRRLSLAVLVCANHMHGNLGQAVG